VNQNAVDTINQGRIHIVEPDLEEQVAAAVSKGLLKAQTKPENADVFMICVPTPFHHEGEIPQPNMDYVVAAGKAIAPFVRPGNLVILESTSPVGSTELVRDTLAKEGVATEGLNFAYCPERVLPGQIMRELVENDRIVGGLTPEAGNAVAEFYRTFVSKGEVLVTDARTAEMCKLTENSFRDVNIAFANELSMICHKNGINPRELITLANRHPRVNILNPGAGVGGHCIAVDPWFIVAMDPANAKLIRRAREINDGKSIWTLTRIEEAAAAFESKHGRPAKIAALGLAFKPNIDDLRESPALEITGKLIAAGYEIMAVEPNLEEHHNIKLVPMDQAVEKADILAVLVAHDRFQSLNTEGKIVLDFCGLLKYRMDSVG
jgi:UDP-N-acetyl-D-mannosaminuronic acid dehydrogenase